MRIVTSILITLAFASQVLDLYGGGESPGARNVATKAMGAQREKRSYRGLEVVVSAPAETPAGQPIDGTITVRNRGDETVFVHFGMGYYDWKPEVKDSHGGQKAPTAKGRVSGANSWNLGGLSGKLLSCQLRPGEAMQSTIRLSLLWDLSTTDSCVFSASQLVTFPPSAPGQEREECRIFNECSFEITPAPEPKITRVSASQPTTAMVSS